MRRFVRIFTGGLFILCLVCSVHAATYTVTKIADTNDGMCDSDCSLREAIAAAGATADNDTIVFSSLFNLPQTIVLSGTDLQITNNGTLSINGPGADKLTVSGNNASRVFTNNTGAVTTISGLRVTGGTAASTVQTGRGGGIYNNGGTLTLNGLIITGNAAANGGGANNAGTATLTINNTAIFSNTATGAGGALQNFSGNTTHIINSSIYGNTCNSTFTGGGAIQANGTVNIINSTMANNRAQGGSGGAIYFNGAAMNVTNSTISGNTSTNNGGAIHRTGSNPLNARNSIFAGNMGAAASTDVTGAVTSQGNNIIGTVGTSTGWVASDLQNTNPLLAPLGFYGGNGLSFALLSGSPALDAGQNCVVDLSCATANPPVAITTDQRGAARPFSATVDIGSFEANSNYIAVLPRATLNQPYNFTLANNFSGFTFLLSSGTFGGITLTSGASSAVLSGTPVQTGAFLGMVQVTNNSGNSATINYAIQIFSDSASVSVSGVVYDQFGKPAKNAVVYYTNQSGIAQSVRTNNFGRFYFPSVAVGDTITVDVFAKGMEFNSQIVVVTDSVSGLIFTAQS